MELELRHLRTVCVIAETGSLTKAAAVLRMSQPALSARLKRLEQEVGAPLFARHPQGMVPTSVGDFVLLRARAILHGVAELRRDAARYTRHATAVVALGGVVGSVSVGLAERLADHLPDRDVRLTMDYSPLLLWDLVTAGRLDVATTVDYPGYELHPTPAVHCEPIVREPVFVAVAATDPLADRAEIPLGELADRTWVMTPSDGAGWPDCFHAACEQEGFRPRVRYTTPSSDSIRALVSGGRAVAACQPVYLPSDEVVVRPIAGNPVSMRHVLVCPREGTLAGWLPTIVRLAREAYWAYVRDHTAHFEFLSTGNAV
ncbi:LysR family transcriptional regulator [Actinosynnema sp. NPDC047251]|uniref:Transcriptional regulator, LysR family n=1 Tax=Saccharothrix espanaensis (strain ATCC 51144 / DSM 44229 / JCM 9112 / NBRC 15066 / NRRL 15764) TaxID=1179773 RepID=K0JV23_SACES|nr:LysR family transcriptional regulator [Saccharothrix espanaensis]CCH28589.1 Transcriptional regulator, LysR family [Saccharothrix espanaensis DSM 44229]